MNKQPQDREHAQVLLHGRYKLLRELGRGGFGSVYLAEDTLLERHVAMKVMSGFGNMFTALTEVTLLASLPPHPNICPYQRTLTVNGSPTIIMPYAERGSLARAIHELPKSPDRIVELALQAAFGLNQVHAFEVIHGDIKPQNLLLFDSGTLAVADFGLALHSSRAERGRLGGTRAYLPPDGEEFGVGADWYAWALTFIEASLGYRTWKRGADALESIEAAGDLATSSSSLQILLSRLLGVPPQERPSMAQELIHELRAAYLELTGIPAPIQPPLVARSKDVPTYVPGLHRLDLVGPALGPTVLLVRSAAAMSEAGLDDRSVLAIHDDDELPANQASSIASSIVTYGRIVDALLETRHDDLKPLIAETWSEMGLAYAYLGDLPGAVEAQTEALRTLDQLRPIQDHDKTNRKAVGIALRLAEAYCALGAFDKAHAVLENMLAHATTFIVEFELKVALANIYSDLGRHELASKKYSELIARMQPEPNDHQLARLYYERALCMAQLRRLQEAEADVRRSLALILPEAREANSTASTTGQQPIPRVSLTTQLPLSLKLLGTVLTDSGRHDEAVKVYELAVKGFEELSETMPRPELQERIASLELSMSYSLGAMGEVATAERVLRGCIERRRELLAAGHDASAVGLANSLRAMAQRRIACGEHIEARSAAMECLRLAVTLEATGSRYNVHEIALNCFVLVLDMDDIDGASRLQLIRWALAEIDAVESIAGSLVDRPQHLEHRVRLLFNLARHVKEPSQSLMILDEAYKLAVPQSGPNNTLAPLACEILLKSAAIKSASGDRIAALADAQTAIKLSRKAVDTNRELDGAVSATYALQLANSLMLSAILMRDGGVPAHEAEPAEIASAAAESISIIRAINADDLEAHQCSQAAQTLGVAANFLAQDERRNASDAMLGFRMSMLALHKKPSGTSLQEISRFAQSANTRCLACDDIDGATAILREVQDLENSVSFPDTIRNAALNMLNELAAHLAHRIAEYRNR